MKPFRVQEFDQKRAEDRRPNFLVPDRNLLLQRLRMAHGLDLGFNPRNLARNRKDPNRKPGTARLEQVRKGRVGVPKVERVRGEVRRKLGLEEVQEIRVVPVPKDLPKVRIRQRRDPRQLELKHIVLTRVHVDAVDSADPMQRILERIAPATRDNQHPVLPAQIHHPQVLPRIFPGECVDVGRETGDAGGVKGHAPAHALTVHVVC
jgi:hypothetical protein